MSKIIGYIDTRQATIETLKDYHDQLWKMENDPPRLEFIESNQVEGALCEAIDHKTVMEHGYNQAVRYYKEFEPCWERLTDEERDLLETRFIKHLEKNWAKKIMQKYNIEKTTAYSRSSAALDRLAKLLFW